jgi:4-amino-4-deoxy-L-arabinose transferase-like glycosyltransferase
MPETRLGAARLASIAGLSALSLGIGLGSSGRLTYHEAFVAQGAREMIARGAVLVPTIDGQPWLEKPPLTFWLVAIAGRLAGDVTEVAARTPSAIAATLLALGVAVFTSRRFGPTLGWLAGLVQATTSWLIFRGRLAEADILLACLVTGTMLAFDRLRTGESGGQGQGPHSRDDRIQRTSLGSGSPSSILAGPAPTIRRPDPPWDRPGAPASPCWRWAFFAGLGATALVKGLGFGAVLVGSAMAVVLIWDRDRRAIRALGHPGGWCLAAVVALTWPALVAIRLPAAVSLWALHVTDRLSARPEHFIGGPWWQYGPAILLQAMPWTPLVAVGAGPSLLRAIRCRGGGDRLLWAWAVVPVLVLSSATVKNAHYAIHALPPLSAWAAMGLTRLGLRLGRRGWSEDQIRRGAAALFLALGLGAGLGHLGLGPRLDRRGAEWGFCQRIGRTLGPSTPLVCLYEDWDRKPYPTPFGPVPHDWAVRLFYLNRAACWRQGAEDLAARPPGPGVFALLGRDRDLPALGSLGRVELLGRGPADRFDRTFSLFRIHPEAPANPDRPGHDPGLLRQTSLAQ